MILSIEHIFYRKFFDNSPISRLAWLKAVFFYFSGAARIGGCMCHGKCMGLCPLVLVHPLGLQVVYGLKMQKKRSLEYKAVSSYCHTVTACHYATATLLTAV